MGNLDRLVVGVDGSSAAAAAVAWAAERVPPTGSLHLIHAMEAGREPSSTAAGPEPSDQRSEIEGKLQREWTEPARDRGFESVEILDGDPAEALLTAAAKYEADAIVVGPHSSSHKRGALGSVTRRLLQHGSLPIVVAKTDRTDLARQGPPPTVTDSTPAEARPVVACVGYGDATEEAAKWAAEYAARRSLPLFLLHVVGYRPIFPADSPSDMLASYLGSDVLKEWAAEDLREIRDEVRKSYPDLTIAMSVDVGFASRAILAASAGAELVTLGKRRENVALRYLISPRIHRLIAKAGTTVVIVPSCSTED